MSGKEFTKSWGVSGWLIEQLGDGFIKDNGTAISELVKNSYDADATKVIINFENAFAKDLTDSRVSISDNGSGMDKDELDYFFTVGDPHKRKKKENAEGEPFSPVYGRWLHGERGLGRFGLQKLGFYSTVITRKAGHPTYSFEIDWLKFRELENVQDYEITIMEDDDEWKDAFSGDRTGTMLIVNHLKKGMGGSNLQTIHRKLSSLVNPFASENDFSIEMKGLVGGKLRWAGFEQAAVVAQQGHYHFDFTLDPSSRHMTYNFAINHPWNNNNGKVWKDQIVPVKSEKGVVGLMDRFPKISGLNGNLFVFFRQPNLLTEAPIMASWGKVTDDQWYDMCGIKIYRDTARVYPYGNRTGKMTVNDSLLGINALAASNTRNWLRQNQFIGAIAFDGEKNPKLTDTSNREGLQTHQEEYRDLQDLLKGIVKFLKTELIDKNGHRSSKPTPPEPPRPVREKEQTTIILPPEPPEPGPSGGKAGVPPPLPPPIPVSVPMGGGDDWKKISKSIEGAKMHLRELGPHSGKEKLERNIDLITKLMEDAKRNLGEK